MWNVTPSELGPIRTKEIVPNALHQESLGGQPNYRDQ